MGVRDLYVEARNCVASVIMGNERGRSVGKRKVVKVISGFFGRSIHVNG